MCETFANFRKRKAFEKMLIVKSQFARSNSDTDFFLSMKKQKETTNESKTDFINLEKQFVNQSYNPKKAKYAKLLNKDKRKLSQFILSNTSNLRLYGNKRYNEYHPFLFVRDQAQKIPNSKIGLLPLPMKSHKKLKTKEDIKRFKDVERSIVMMRRIQYTRKNTDSSLQYGKTVDLSSIIRIQRWWKLMLKIIKIQRLYKARCRKKEAKLISRLSDFLTNFDSLLVKKLKRNCLYVFYNYTKNTTVINCHAFFTKKSLRISKNDSKKIVKIQSSIRAYLKKMDLYQQFKLSNHKVKPILFCCYITQYPKSKNMIVAMNMRRIIIHWRKYIRNKNKMVRMTLLPSVIVKKVASYPNISAKKIESMYRKYSAKLELAIGKYNKEDIMRYKRSMANYFYTKDSFCSQINPQFGKSIRDNKTKDKRDDIDNNDKGIEVLDHTNLNVKDKKTNSKATDNYQTSKYSSNVYSNPRLKGKSVSINVEDKNGELDNMTIISREMINQLFKYEKNVSMITKSRIYDNSKSVITIQKELNNVYLNTRKRKQIQLGYVDKLWINILTQNIITFTQCITNIMSKSYFSKKTKKVMSQKYFTPNKTSSRSLNSNELEHVILMQKEYKTYSEKNNKSSILKPNKSSYSSSINKSRIRDIISSILVLQRNIKIFKLNRQSQTLFHKNNIAISYLSKCMKRNNTLMLCDLQIKLKNYLYTGKVNSYLDYSSTLKSNNQLFTKKTMMSNMKDMGNAISNANTVKNKSLVLTNPIALDVCYISMTKIEKNGRRIENIRQTIMKYNKKVNRSIKEAKAFIKPKGNGWSVTKDRFDIKEIDFTSPREKYYPTKKELSSISIITKERTNDHNKEIIKIQSLYRAILNKKPISKLNLRLLSFFNQDSDLITNRMTSSNKNFDNSNVMFNRRDMKSFNSNQSFIKQSNQQMNQFNQLKEDLNDNINKKNLNNVIQETNVPTWYVSKERISNVQRHINNLQSYVRRSYNRIQKPLCSSVYQTTKLKMNREKDIGLIIKIQNNVRQYLPKSIYASSSFLMMDTLNKTASRYSSKFYSANKPLAKSNANSNQYDNRPNKIAPISDCSLTKIRKTDQYSLIINLQKEYLKQIKKQKDITSNKITIIKMMTPICYSSKIVQYNIMYKPKANSSFISKQIYIPKNQFQSIHGIQKAFRSNHSKLRLKNKIKQNNLSKEITLDYLTSPKTLLTKITYKEDSYITKEYKRLINKPNLMFISLLTLFANKNAQEHIFAYLKSKGKAGNFTYPFYITAIERNVKFIKSSQAKDSKVKEVFNEIFSSENIRNIHEQIALLPKAKIKQLHSVNIYHSIEQDLINYLNSFCIYDKRLSNPAFISERLKQNKINNTNIFGLTRLIDDEYNNLLNGKYCYRCYFNINSCHCALPEEEDDLFNEDSMHDSPSKNRFNHFEYDSTTCKGVIIKRKPKTEEGYEDPITQMICISDDQLIKKLQIKTSALIPRKKNNESYENEKEEIKMNNTTDISPIHQDKDDPGSNDTNKNMSNLKQLILKHGNSNDKSNYIEFDYNAEEEK